MRSWNSYQIHLSLLLFAYSLVLWFFHLPICASKAERNNSQPYWQFYYDCRSNISGRFGVFYVVCFHHKIICKHSRALISKKRRVRNCFYCVKEHTGVYWGTSGFSFKAQLTFSSAAFTIFCYVFVLKFKKISCYHSGALEETKLYYIKPN